MACVYVIHGRTRTDGSNQRTNERRVVYGGGVCEAGPLHESVAYVGGSLDTHAELPPTLGNEHMSTEGRQPGTGTVRAGCVGLGRALNEVYLASSTCEKIAAYDGGCRQFVSYSFSTRVLLCLRFLAVLLTTSADILL